jgi:hypothetical protein
MLGYATAFPGCLRRGPRVTSTGSRSAGASGTTVATVLGEGEGGRGRRGV